MCEETKEQVSQVSEPQPVPAVQEDRKPVATDYRTSIFSEVSSFEEAQKKAMALSNSIFVPNELRASVVGTAAATANCLVVMDMAMSMGVPTEFLLQNMCFVHGQATWRATFLIGQFDKISKYTGIRYDHNFDTAKSKEEMWCRAYTYVRETGEKIEGSRIDWKLVSDEGYNKKSGSKWLTMPEQMFRYRAAVFFIRSYAPNITYGLYEQTEIEDVKGNQITNLKEKYTNNEVNI